MALTATLDAATYLKGSTITLTVVRDAVAPVSVVVTDAVGETATPTAVISDPLTVADAARTWTVASDDGVTAVYTSVA